MAKIYANLVYGALTLSLLIYALFFIFPLLAFSPDAPAPGYAGAPGYFLHSPLGGDMRVIPFSGPEFKNPAANPGMNELAPANRLGRSSRNRD